MKTNSSYLNDFRENGRRIALIKQELVAFAQTHLKLEQIEAKAVELIKKAGGEPAFMRVPGYSYATCISVNSGFVHGIPKGNLKPGDIVTIDTGMVYKDTTTDTATTFVIGPATPEQDAFLNLGKKTLKKAVQAAQAGNQVRHISETIQRMIEKGGCNVTRNLTGHGVGKTMHESPAIPCFTSKSDPNLRVRLVPGMVLAIEVMYMKGQWPLVQADDGWTLSTADGSDSAVFEEDVIITENGPEVITTLALEAVSKV